jgi:hypothetical protein
MEAIAELDECDVHVTGLRRRKPISRHVGKSIEKPRQADLIEQAMLATDQMSLKLPTATLSLVTDRRRCTNPHRLLRRLNDGLLEQSGRIALPDGQAGIPTE